MLVALILLKNNYYQKQLVRNSVKKKLYSIIETDFGSKALAIYIALRL